MKYKTFDELKDELGDSFEEYMYKANINLLEQIRKVIEYIKEHTYINDDCDYGFERSFTVQDEKLDKLLSELKGE